MDKCTGKVVVFSVALLYFGSKMGGMIALAKSGHYFEVMTYIISTIALVVGGHWLLGKK